MSRQQNLEGDISDIDRADIYYRPAKDRDRAVEPTRNPIESPVELADIEELLGHIQSEKLLYPNPLKNSDMQELTKHKIRDILRTDSSDTISLKHSIKDLLSLFCGSLVGRQLEESKYAMLVDLGDSFLLAHVKAERGISIKEEKGEIELIRRFLDIDNILSAAYFEIENGDIVFSHFTDTGSDAFRDFLGVSKTRYHYEKKNVQFLCYYHGKKGVEVKFEFSNEELEDEWINQGAVSLTNNQLKVNNEVGHRVKEVRWGNERYESLNAFKSDFKEYAFSLDQERERYKRLLSMPGGSATSIFSSDDVQEIIDLREEILFKNTGGEDVFKEKGVNHDDLHIIYANNQINIDAGYATEIFNDISSNLNITVFHPSEPAAASDLKVNNISFLNIDMRDVSPEFIDLTDTIHNHAINATGETVTKMLVSVLLNVIIDHVSDPYEEALKQIINVNIGSTRDKDVVSTKEQEGSGLIEYKNRQSLEKSSPHQEIVSQIETAINRGISQKIFLWGFTEQTRQIDGLETQKWNDDRVSGIESAVTGELDGRGIDYHDFNMLNLELGNDGEKWVIAGLFH